MLSIFFNIENKEIQKNLKKEGNIIKHKKIILYKKMDKPHGHLSTSHNNSYACHPLRTNLEQYKKTNDHI
jgi:hypothetical protein